jgi:hypothetical protein
MNRGLLPRATNRRSIRESTPVAIVQPRHWRGPPRAVRYRSTACHIRGDRHAAGLPAWLTISPARGTAGRNLIRDVPFFEQLAQRSDASTDGVPIRTARRDSYIRRIPPRSPRLGFERREDPDGSPCRMQGRCVGIALMAVSLLQPRAGPRCLSAPARCATGGKARTVTRAACPVAAVIRTSSLASTA